MALAIEFLVAAIFRSVCVRGLLYAALHDSCIAISQREKANSDKNLARVKKTRIEKLESLSSQPSTNQKCRDNKYEQTTIIDEKYSCTWEIANRIYD